MEGNQQQSEVINYEEMEQKILSIISQYSRLKEEFERRLKKDLQIILLIGQTGAGKSTLFNFLMGAQYKFVNDPLLGNELKLASLNGSPIRSGMTSITKEPYYYFIESNNHLLIDFPGFLDTRGEIEQLLIQLFFHRLVTLAPVKIVYVLRHPENTLTDRGQQLQEFIKTQFQEQNLDICKFTILLNSYCEDLEVKALIKGFQQQFQQKYEISYPENVFVIRKVKNIGDLQKTFSEESRQKLLEDLIKTKKLKFTPKTIPRTEILTKYLRKAGERILSHYCSLLTEITNQNLLNKDKSILNQLLNLLKGLLTKYENKNISKLIWFQDVNKTCVTLTELIKIQNQIFQTQNFQSIFSYFSDFADYITGYCDFRESCQGAADQTKSTVTAIESRIGELAKEEQIRQQQQQINQQQIYISWRRKKFFEKLFEKMGF